MQNAKTTKTCLEERERKTGLAVFRLLALEDKNILGKICAQHIVIRFEIAVIRAAHTLTAVLVAMLTC